MATLTIPNAFVAGVVADPAKVNANFSAVETAVNANLAAYTAADVLAKLLTVDIDASGLNATTLQGNAPAAFATAAQGTKADDALPAADAVSTNTANKAVKRGASGEFAAGVITATFVGDVTGNVSGSSGSCTGNAATATTATTAGTCTGNAATVTTNANLTGDVTSVGNATTLAKVPVGFFPLFLGVYTDSGTVETPFTTYHAWKSAYATGRTVKLSAVMAHNSGKTITIRLKVIGGATLATITSSGTSYAEVLSSGITISDGALIYATAQGSAADAGGVGACGISIS